MSEARDAEIVALRDLTRCAGWQRFAEEARAQWQGEAFVGRMKMAITGQPQATDSVRELFAGRKAIEDLLTWPERRTQKLEADAAADQAGTPTVVRRA